MKISEVFFPCLPHAKVFLSGAWMASKLKDFTKVSVQKSLTLFINKLNLQNFN